MKRLLIIGGVAMGIAFVTATVAHAQTALTLRQSDLSASYLIGGGGDGKSGGGSDSERTTDRRKTIDIKGFDENEGTVGGNPFLTSARYAISHEFQFTPTGAGLARITSGGLTETDAVVMGPGLANINDGNRLELQFTVASETEYSLLATVADTFADRPHAVVSLEAPGLPGLWIPIHIIAADTTQQFSGVLQVGLYRMVATADAPGRSDGFNSASWNYDLTLTPTGTPISAPEPGTLALTACSGAFVLAGRKRGGRKRFPAPFALTNSQPTQQAS